jgi:hypothetical protein
MFVFESGGKMFTNTEYARGDRSVSCILSVNCLEVYFVSELSRSLAVEIMKTTKRI